MLDVQIGRTGKRGVSNQMKAFLSLCFMGQLFAGAGCSSPDDHAETLPSAVEATAQVDSTTPSIPTRRLVRDTWDVVMIGGAKVGYSHFQVFETKVEGQPIRELVSSIELSMQRFGQTITQSIEAASTETVDGQVQQFSTKILTGPSELKIAGEVDGDKLKITTTTLGKTQHASIDWNPAWGGFFAVEESMIQKPMQPGETREIFALIPAMAQPETVRLVASKRERVKLLSGERELLRIENTLESSQTTIKSTHWADETGEVLKISMPNMNHESYRTTKEIALSKPQKTDFDLGQQTVVKVDKLIASPHATKKIVYRARLSNGSPVESFSDCESQSVKKLDDHTAEITVRAIRPKDELTRDVDGPSESDLQPNNLIQSDDGAIISLAARFAEGETDAWKLVQRFELGVRDYVHSKNFSQAISSAADVVRSQEGDCTEHAVLLAALCRAKNIPARVVIGLVYYRPVQGLAYHMWNEVWIADRWVPVDGTLGRGGIGAAHIKIADSDLSSISPISALLPVIEVIGQLEIEVLSVE